MFKLTYFQPNFNVVTTPCAFYLSGFISFDNSSFQALSTIDKDHSSANGFLEDFNKTSSMVGAVSSPKCLQYNSFDWRTAYRFHLGEKEDYQLLDNQKQGSSNKSVDIMERTCHQQADIRMRSHCLRQLVDDKSVASCQQICSKFIVKTCYPQACCKLF